eukprot:g3691.t1
MAHLIGLRAEIDAVDVKIAGIESKEALLEAALEGHGSYLGTTDHGELRGFHERLMKEKEQLRKKEEQLREKELVLLRQQQTVALAPGGAGSSSISDQRSRDTCGEAVETVGRNECQKRKRPKSGARVAIKNEGGASAIATTGGAGAGTGAAPAWRCGDVIDVSEDSGSASPMSTGRACVPGASKPAKRGGARSSGGCGSAACADFSLSTGAVEEDACDSDGGVEPMPKNEGAMTLFVKLLTGETIIIRASPGTFVEDFKQKVQDVRGYPPEEQRILYVGKQLEDRRTLSYYKISNHSTLHLILRLRGGKPVILLYPPAPVDATVTLELSPLWSFSALYPKPPSSKFQQAVMDPELIVARGQQCKWNVHASPDGSLEDLSTGREYPYLFWEADSSDGQVSRSFGLDQTRSFCVAGDAAGVFLDGALERLGLNTRERCDMVTYWLPQLESSPFNVGRYEKAARLTIAPAPDVTIRVFMAFRGVDAYDAKLNTAKVGDLVAPAREGFVAVEWGGMNLNGASHD